MIDEYFEWLFKIATNDKSRRYRELCEFLFSKDFYYTNEYDANRVGDGLNLRERFIDEHRMSINICKIHQKHTHRVLFRFKIGVEVKRKEF